MGPEGGSGGGTVVAQGTPEEVAAVEASHTGGFLRHLLEAAPAKPARGAARGGRTATKAAATKPAATKGAPAAAKRAPRKAAATAPARRRRTA